MNQLQKKRQKIENLKLIKRDSLYGTRVGCAKYWKGTSYEHWRVLSDILWKLSSQGYDCIPEAEFKKGGRADLVAIDSNGNAYAIEVLHSETDKRFEEKLEKYPFPIIKVRTKDFNINTWDL